MPKIRFNCLCCGTECEKYDSHTAGKYCSHSCYIADKVNRLRPIKCPICSSVFQGPANQIYCCDICKRKRDHASELVEYNNTCPRCGAKWTMTIKKPRYLHSNTLCRICAARQAKITAPSPKGSASSAWKGGRRIDGHGYVKVHVPGHPFADSTNYVREHLFVVTQAFGEEYVRSSGGVVHYINGDKQDNNLENLIVCTPKQNADYNRQLLEIAFKLVKIGAIEFVDEEYSCPLLSDEIGEPLKVGEP